MISNRCARKSLVTNCNSITSKNYLQFLVDSNDFLYVTSTKIRKIITQNSSLSKKKDTFAIRTFNYNNT